MPDDGVLCAISCKLSLFRMKREGFPEGERRTGDAEMVMRLWTTKLALELVVDGLPLSMDVGETK